MKKKEKIKKSRKSKSTRKFLLPKSNLRMVKDCRDTEIHKSIKIKGKKMKFLIKYSAEVLLWEF